MVQHREDCLRLDASDPLAQLREQFALPEGVIYLDGNSLGARPKAALARAQQVVSQEWGEQLIRSWNDAGWFALPRTLGNRVARLIGAADDEVVVTDSTSINLFKVLAAALRQQQQDAPGRRVIVSELSNFPTDLYMAEGLTRLLGDFGSAGWTLRLIDDPAQLASALDDQVAVVMLTHVHYQTGHLYDMAAVTTQVHQHGALMVWDLAHSAGAVPVDLNGANADYAIGCTYKYLNGGPGSPAFLWVPKRLQGRFEQPLSGWWGHARPFAMEPGYQPSGDVGRFLCGTQGIVSMSLVGCGLDIFEQTSMAALRQKSLALTSLFINLVETRCAGYPLQLITPRDPARRGSQVSFTHPHGFAVMQALIERGVIGDYREPQIMRFGFTPLYTRYQDVWDAVSILLDLLQTQGWNQERFHRRGAVT